MKVCLAFVWHMDLLLRSPRTILRFTVSLSRISKITDVLVQLYKSFFYPTQ